LETVLYELSVAGALGGQEVGGGPKNKRIKVDENSQGMVEEEKCNDLEMEPSALDAFKQEIAKIKERMDYRDKLRENLIKTSRDGQKSAKVSILLSRGVVQMHTAAILYQMLTYAQNFVITICLKNAIFALHRGNTKSAAKLLEDCENCVRNDLFPIVQEDPTLRGGSFSNVLEEYVEGKLFYCWLHGDGGEEESGGVSNNNKPAGKILMFDEIHLPITVDEYIGGLCDLTGEIGRFAVARGTVRDKESVKLCLETSKNICMAIKMAGKLPGNINKKMNPLQNTVDKITRILYEQSLMEMAGRKFISSMEEGEFDAED
jgi:predicted translin family RNA/ssDNA-binding protein